VAKKTVELHVPFRDTTGLSLLYVHFAHSITPTPTTQYTAGKQLKLIEENKLNVNVIMQATEMGEEELFVREGVESEYNVAGAC
jgi:hypothetical protein